MAIIQSPKAENKAGSASKKQTFIVPKMGPYYGFCSRYNLPKERSFVARGKTITQEEVGFGFVIVLDQAYRQLPHFCDAFASAKNEHGYNPDTQWTAKLTQYIHALCGGKKTHAEIVDDVFDYDTFVGRPVELMIEPSQGSNGRRYNNVKGISVIDKDGLNALKDLLGKRTFGKTQSGLCYLEYPTAEYEEDAQPSAQQPEEDINFDGIEDPF